MHRRRRPEPRYRLSGAQRLFASVGGTAFAHPHDHNGGPPLDDTDDHVPEWGSKGIRTYFAWKRAHNQVWKTVPRAIMLRRLEKARACGLTYEEYSLFLFDTGRYLQPTDTEIITSIIAGR